MSSGDQDETLMRRLEGVYAGGPSVPIDEVATLLGGRLAGLGADAGFVATLSSDRTMLEVARVTPFSTAPVRLAFSADAPYPLAHVIRSDEAIFITSNEALACDHPGLLRVRDEDHACATLPLHGAEGAVIGSANVSWEAPREFSDADRDEVAALLAECEQELARRLAAA
jgi:hypothetical protein